MINLLLVLIIAQYSIIYLLIKLVGDTINKVKDKEKIGREEELIVGDSFPFKNLKINADTIRAEDEVVILFINSACKVCKLILDSANQIAQTSYFKNRRLVIINEKKEKLKFHEDNIIYLAKPEVFRIFGVEVVPMAVYVSENKRIMEIKGISKIEDIYNYPPLKSHMV